MSDQDQKLDALLNAYVDRRLDEQASMKVESWLESKPEVKAEIDQFTKVTEQLRAAFGDNLQVPVSDRLQRFVESYPASKLANGNKVNDSKWWASLKSYFNVPHIAIYTSLVVISLIFGVFIPFGLRDTGENVPGFYQQIEQLALDAHRIYSQEKRHAVEVPASDKVHMMKWLSKRLSADIGPPQLDQFAYKLIGGRLLPAAGKHAALYMYGDDEGHRLTIYIRLNESSQKNIVPNCTMSSNTESTCSWQGEKLIYFLIGPADDKISETIARFCAKLLNK